MQAPSMPLTQSADTHLKFHNFALQKTMSVVKPWNMTKLFKLRPTEFIMLIWLGLGTLGYRLPVQPFEGVLDFSGILGPAGSPSIGFIMVILIFLQLCQPVYSYVYQFMAMLTCLQPC